MRSDNLCFAGGQVKLVDWNLAHTGNPIVDVAFWRRRPAGVPEILQHEQSRLLVVPAD